LPLCGKTKKTMHRKPILDLLNQHQAFDANEARMVADTIRFINENPDCFHRSLAIGHITASAWVIDSRSEKALLTHHRKLNSWFQLGGHCDGDPDVLASARREVEEESGLSNFKLAQETIFDVDVHLIPASSKEAAHYHYDIRFLFEADSTAALIISAESKDLAWIKYEEIKNYNQSESIIRMVEKMVV
jgi:8-oxo-dGTP pyrophosphatase MutT (NUDIX family)